MSFVTDSLELIESLQSQLHAAQQEKHSFARSQAIEFAEWIVANDYRATVGCKNWAKWNPASSTWIYRTTA